ncbi:Phage protein [Lactococcus lactis subsp. lactis]|uniref:Phage protein n=1 Tax=Lactococcus lactis subsp. lactis TaxID=1360 RepID=A0A0V8EK63_LACLL|nr:hypothetical protein [Lactococcus lactis]KSU26056.1 Phage protein [Lactococcus lactis subsp. lactis]
MSGKTYDLKNEIEARGLFDLQDEKIKNLKKELDDCIQTLISVSILVNGDENIVIGNFVDSRLSKFAKTHENVTKYIEKVAGKNIDVVLAENAALEEAEIVLKSEYEKLKDDNETMKKALKVIYNLPEDDGIISIEEYPSQIRYYAKKSLAEIGEKND